MEISCTLMRLALGRILARQLVSLSVDWCLHSVLSGSSADARMIWIHDDNEMQMTNGVQGDDSVT